MGVSSGVSLEREDGVAVLTIDRPASRNAIGLRTMTAINAAIGTVALSDARVLAVRGGGERTFVSGGDLKELGALRTRDDAQAMALTMRRLLDDLSLLKIPVLGVLNGDAYGGGCEVAMACDFRVAASDISLAFNQVALGIIPAWGGIERLAAIVGRSRAMYLLTTAHRLSASDAFAWGLVEEVLPRADFDSGWRRLAQALAAASPDALMAIKSVVIATQNPTRQDLEQSSTAAFASTWTSDAHWDAVDELFQRREVGGLRRTEAPQG